MILIVVIDSYAQRIESINMHIFKDSGDGSAIIQMLDRLDLLRFEATYLSLASLLKRLRPVKPRILFNTPPGQTTVPGDPNYSGGSIATSSSLESKPEAYAQNVANDFLKATRSSIVKWLGGMEWANPEAKVYLFPQYVIIVLF
jgi:hypothetical protein